MNLFQKKNIKPLFYFLNLYPFKSFIIVVALVLSALMEALSFAVLLPLLNFTLKSNDTTQTDSFIQNKIEELFQFFGISFALENVIITVAILMVLKSIISFNAIRQVGDICADVEKDLRSKIVETVFQAKWSFFLNNKVGDISSALSSQVQKGANLFKSLGMITAGIIQVLFYASISYMISPIVTIFGFLLGLVVMFFLSGYVKISKSSAKLLTKHQATLISRLIDSFRSMKSNKILGVSQRLLNYLNTDIEKLALMRKRIVLSSSILKTFQEPIQIVIILISLYFLISFWDGSTEELIVLILLFYRSGMRFGHIQIFYQLLITSYPAFNFIMNIITNAKNFREEIFKGEDILKIKSIEFDNVSFSFGSKEILKNISLKINSGDFIAIVGPSGSGKTTLIDLILGFYEPENGILKVNEKNILDLSKNSLRRNIGYVPQESSLFFDSIRNNITYGDKNISDEKVVSVLEKTKAMDFINLLPNGIDTLVGEEGGKLSGGQKQRICISRALLHNPNVLILDEPTSALDDLGEKEILETLENFKGEVTIISISHNETFINSADKVIKLDNEIIV